MEQGALGLSTSLIYPPGSYARRRAVALAGSPPGTAASTPPTSATKAPEMEALEEAFTISREAGIPVEIWHLKVAGRRNWGRMGEVVARIERARAEGLDVTADMYPYVGQRERARQHGAAVGPRRRRAEDAGALPRPRAAPAHPQGDPRGRGRGMGRLEGPAAGGHPHHLGDEPRPAEVDGEAAVAGGGGDGEASGGGAARPGGGRPGQRLRGPLLDERGRPAGRAAEAVGGPGPGRRRLCGGRAAGRGAGTTRGPSAACRACWAATSES